MVRIDGELFTLYVEKVLAPTLAPGEIIVLDNLGSHKGKAARKAIHARGAHLIFLPPPHFGSNARILHATAGTRGETLAEHTIFRPRRQLIVGMTNSAPDRMPVGHRVVIVFSLV